MFLSHHSLKKATKEREGIVPSACSSADGQEWAGTQPTSILLAKLMSFCSLM